MTPSSGPSYEYWRGAIRSFDCTPIVFNLFEPTDASSSHPVYTILEGPGWGSAGSTTPDPHLISNDYAELTWDPRGFGQSGGVAEVDDPMAEGKDVSALIGYVLAPQPEIAKDTGGVNQPAYGNDATGSTAGQPAVGMTGVSYGGGIEFATAAFDNRVKAIAPGWAWNNLDYSLFPGGSVKLGWDELLFGVGIAEGGAAHAQGDTQALPGGSLGGTAGVQVGGYDPNIDEAEAKGVAMGTPDGPTEAWFLQRSLAGYGNGLGVPGGGSHVPDIPTLFIQGTVDTLFNLNEAWANYEQMGAAHPGLAMKLIAFCGGHVSCPTGGAPTGIGYSDTASSTSPYGAGLSQSTFTEDATISWFDTYLRGSSVSANAVDAATLPTVTYQDQTGNFYGATSFPTSDDGFAGTSVACGATPCTDVANVTVPSSTLVSHGVPNNLGPAGEDTLVTDQPTASGDPGQVTIPVVTAGSGGLEVVGEPHLNLSVTVLGSSTTLYFRLVDQATGNTVDLQTAAVHLDNLDQADNFASPNLPPHVQQVSLDLVGVAYDLPAGDTLELQISTSSVSFESNRGTAVVQLSGSVQVPTFTKAS